MYDELYVWEMLQKDREREWEKMAVANVELKARTYNRLFCGVPIFSKLLYCKCKCRK
jgi:hypothetical protein